MNEPANSGISPLYEKIKDSIKQEIYDHILSPGKRIPSERALAEIHGVSRITAKRAIADLIMEGFLEHVPNQRGTFVKQQKDKNVSLHFIAVAIDDVRNSFGAQILRGIEDFLWNEHIHTLICNADRDFPKVEEYFRSLLDKNITGVIFAPVIDEGYREKNRKLVEILEKARIPYTLIDRYIPGKLANYVGANHEESSRTITRYLFDRGHKRIILARGLECTSMDERVQGYLNAHEEAGYPVDKRLIISANENLLDYGIQNAEPDRIRDAIKAAGKFTCFYALNDGLFRTGVKALESLGYKPGENVQLASHNEIDFPRYPFLNAIPHFVEPTYEMGWEAARVLVEHIMDPGHAVVQKILKSKFIPPET